MLHAGNKRFTRTFKMSSPEVWVASTAMHILNYNSWSYLWQDTKLSYICEDVEGLWGLSWHCHHYHLTLGLCSLKITRTNHGPGHGLLTFIPGSLLFLTQIFLAHWAAVCQTSLTIGALITSLVKATCSYNFKSFANLGKLEKSGHNNTLYLQYLATIAASGTSLHTPLVRTYTLVQ